MKNSDLHVHSYYSDGELSPKEVVRLAKKKGIKNLAITDHNSVKGIGDAIKEGKKIGINVIPGVEIAAKEDEVLCYYITDYKNSKLIALLNRTSFHENEKIKLRIKALQKRDFNINYKNFVKRFPHSKENYNLGHLSLYLSEEYKISRWEAFKIIHTLKIKKTRKKDLPICQVIRLILKYNGIPVLAHPWADLNSKGLLKEQNFKELILAGLKGIEIDNGDRDERRDIKTLKRIKELAKKYNLIITSGSDFHGNFLIKENESHGIGECNCDESVVKQLKALKEKN